MSPHNLFKPAFDELASKVQAKFNTSWAFVSLIDLECVWFKSLSSAPGRELNINENFLMSHPFARAPSTKGKELWFLRSPIYCRMHDIPVIHLVLITRMHIGMLVHHSFPWKDTVWECFALRIINQGLSSPQKTRVIF